VSHLPRFLTRARGQCGSLSFRICSALALLLGFGCDPYTYTTRIVDGREVQGAPIAPQAYAAYLEGATWEAEGKLAAALDAYDRARDADPDNAELQTAFARVVCRAAPERRAAEFEKAIELDPSYEPSHREQAYCALRHDDNALALLAAERALNADPHGFAATEVMATVLLRQGKLEQAQRYWFAFTVLHPEQAAAQRALQQLRQLKTQPPQSAPAANTLAAARLQRDEPSHFLEPELLLPALRQALRDGDDSKAEALALEARLDRVEFGRLALSQARPDFALQKAQLVLFADPSHADARALSLLAALVLQDGRAYRSALRDRGEALALPSAGGAADLMRVLAIKVSPHAAELFHEAYLNVSAAPQMTPRAPTDPLPHEGWPANGKPTPATP
jgi:hypothetical protein